MFENSLHRRAMLAWLLSATMSTAACPAFAQNYPARPVRVIVPFPAGGALDVLARIVAQRMGEDLGQSFVVENRPGATGHVGSGAVAKAAPDGYTLLFTASSTQVVSPHVMNLTYDPMADLKPVGLVATVNNIIVASQSLPVATMSDLIAYAKRNPGSVTYGSFGVGSNVHLAAELLGILGGLQLRHVPYQTPQIIPDLLSGRLNMMVANIPDVAQHIADGKLRALGATSLERLPDFPNLPTVAEVLPGYEVGAWGMLMAPAATPNDIVERLNVALRNALNTQAVKDAYAAQRFNPAPMSVADTAAFLRRHNDLWARVVREAKIPKAN